MIFAVKIIVYRKIENSELYFRASFNLLQKSLICDFEGLITSNCERVAQLPAKNLGKQTYELQEKLP